MDQAMALQRKTIPEEVRTEQQPAQERLSLEAQDAVPLSADEVYTQRQSETLPGGNLSAPTFIP